MTHADSLIHFLPQMVVENAYFDVGRESHMRKQKIVRIWGILSWTCTVETEIKIPPLSAHSPQFACLSVCKGFVTQHSIFWVQKRLLKEGYHELDVLSLHPQITGSNPMIYEQKCLFCWISRFWPFIFKEIQMYSSSNSHSLSVDSASLQNCPILSTVLNRRTRLMC